MKLYVSALKYSNWYHQQFQYLSAVSKLSCGYTTICIVTRECVWLYCVFTFVCSHRHGYAIIGTSAVNQIKLFFSTLVTDDPMWMSLKTCCCALHLGTVSKVCCSLRFQSAFWSLLSNSSCTLCLCVFSNHQSLFSAITFSGSSASGVKHILF